MACHSIAILLVGAGIVCLAPGCSSDGMVACSGVVTFDGKPLPAGSISFHPLQPSVAPQGAPIADGAFHIRCRPGRQRVEILASRPKEGAKELTSGMTPIEQYVPERYNDASSLEAEVKPQGPNTFTFELVSGHD